jgi:serine/threonine-protein kinase
MAPELFTGMRADARSDQYAFGVTAYELLAGVYPGSATGPVPAALDTLVPEVSPAVARIVARTLSRSADARFATMNEVASALEEEIFTTRVSPTREVATSTRREGAPAPGEAALALAPTELPSPSARASLERAAPATPAAPTLATATPAPRAARGVLVLALAVALGVGAFVASRFLGGAGEPALAREASSSTSDAGGSPNPASVEAEAAAPLVVDPPLDVVDAAFDAIADGDASDASTEGGAVADAASLEVVPRRLPLDDFNDPWAKPPTTSPR